MTCGTTSFCDPTRLGCLPQVCVPGAPACAGDSIGVCSAAGSRVLSPTTDCTDTNQVCFGGVCTSSAVESMGVATYSFGGSAGYMIGDALQPSIPRLLTEFAVELSFTGAMTLTFLVYAGDPGAA